MNSIKTILASLGLAVAIAPALAATEGLPPNLEQNAGHAVQVEATAVRSAAQFLHGQGEVSLVPNPEFNAAKAAAPIRMGRIAPVGYVGA